MQVLLHLPDNIALRLKKAIPAKKRSAFICNLLEQALPDFEEELFNLAILANQDDDKNFNENISCNEFIKKHFFYKKSFTKIEKENPIPFFLLFLRKKEASLNYRVFFHHLIYQPI